MDTSGLQNTPWAAAIAASPRSSEPDTYDVTIAKDWSIASLPLGGYLNSILTNAASTHFALQHPSLAQPDPVTTHCAFLSRAVFGPGIVRITISKSGRQYSNVIARLYQSVKGIEALVAEAMITQGNLARERAADDITLPIANPLPRSAIFERSAGFEMVDPPSVYEFLAAAIKLRRFYPPGTDTVYDGSRAHPLHGPSVREEWLTWNVARSGEKDGFDVQAATMLMDNFQPPAFGFEGIEVGKNWLATLSITTELKKAPPEGRRGWEWLLLRVVMGKCNFGRYTMDIMLLDEEGDVVAVGRRSELVLGGARRSKERGDKSKI